MLTTRFKNSSRKHLWIFWSKRVFWFWNHIKRQSNVILITIENHINDEWLADNHSSDNINIEVQRFCGSINRIKIYKRDSEFSVKVFIIFFFLSSEILPRLDDRGSMSPIYYYLYYNQRETADNRKFSAYILLHAVIDL